MEKERLYKYFSGETSTDEEKVIIDWAEASAENYKIYLKERQYWNTILVNMTSVMEGKKQGSKKINIWMLTTVAASIAILFMLSYILVFADKQDVGWQTIYVPPGQRVQVILSDSTVVWLNSKSTLKYPSFFSSDIRNVQLNGEGYFEVMKKEKTPFVVETSRHNITVSGTSFNVFAYDGKPFFETSLIDGEVLVSQKNKNNSEVILRPSEKIAEINGELTISAIEDFDHFRWREGLICIDDEPLEKMMEKFSLYFDIDIKIENPLLLEYSPTGKFRHSDGIDHALKVLQKDIKFTYIRDNESDEIVIK